MDHDPGFDRSTKPGGGGVWRGLKNSAQGPLIFLDGPAELDTVQEDALRWMKGWMDSWQVPVSRYQPLVVTGTQTRWDLKSSSVLLLVAVPPRVCPLLLVTRENPPHLLLVPDEVLSEPGPGFKRHRDGVPVRLAHLADL